MTPSDILRDAETRMKKTLESAQADFATLRTGRANPSLLDSLKIEYYGQQMPVNQLGTVTAPEPRVLVIQPWDRASLSAIEKAITKSDLGLSPNNDGVVIRLNIPPLTEQRRKDFVKQLANKAEAGRVALRNIRRDAIEHGKKDDEITEDDVKRLEKDVQKLLDRYVAELDSLQKTKETELLET
ncbi:MAG: ribosome recycling factor [Capsulimonadales bacterium]|nr:ribosome recycling factor [Capsulimonadales bacterium]